MTAFDYSRFQASALRLVTRFGTDATIIRAGTPSGPANNPTPGAPTNHECKATPDKWNISQIDGTLIQRGDIILIVPASGLSITPTPADNFVWLGEEYAIVMAKPLNQNGTPILYTVQVRK